MRCAIGLGILLAVGCGGEGAPPDAAVADAAADLPDAGDPHMGLRLPACVEDDPTPTDAVPSTLVRTLVPPSRLAMPGSRNPALEVGEAMYRSMGLHRVSAGPGKAHVRRTDLGAESASTDRRSLAWFAHLSDFQLVDDESPTRLARFDSPGTAGALRAQEAYLPRAVSAMSRTLARIERPERPYDFGVVTGDCADSGQENELQWVISLMNGEPALETDSGDDDDPIPGDDNDPKDPFDPTAFPAPWLYVPGNHDVEIVGINVPTDALRMQALGGQPTGGTRDYRRWYGAVSMSPVPMDPGRALVDRDAIVATVRAAASAGDQGPVGHGYPASGPVDTRLGANWAHDAVPGLLRVLAIDSSDRSGGSLGMITQEMVDGWLIPELDRAVADGVLVMLASHHATLSMDRRNGEAGPSENADALSPEEIEALVASRPEVIAWLVGHTHDNRVRAVPGADAEHPGYWEIMTSAVADYPSQARLIELVDNGDGTMSIFATLVDHDADDCFERRFRALATMEWASGWFDPVSFRRDDHNVELLRAVPSHAVDGVAARRMTAPSRLESLTTLAGM